MKAFLHATGESEKLAPLTDHLPSPLVPILNRPVIAHMIEQMVRGNVKDFVVSLYNLGGSIEAYCGDGRRWGAQMDYVLQRRPLGNAGALKWAASRLTETFIVLPADAIIRFDLAAALQFHRAENCTLTRLVHLGQPTGAYIVEPRVLEHIPARVAFDLETQLIPALTGETVRDFSTDGYVNLLTSFNDYQTAQNDFLQSIDSDAPRVRDVFAPGRRVAAGIWIGRNNVIHPRAQLAPPVCLGDDCFIGDQVELGPHAILGPNVMVDESATIQASTVLDNTYVGRLVHLQDRIVDQTRLIDVNSGETLPIVDDFLLAENTPTSIGNTLARVGNVSVAIVLALLTLPLAILVAVLAFAASGRIIARVTCVGNRASQTFDLLRFQTHRVNGTTNALGRALARWELDRLPEVWNVVRGDLAIVGVKPIAPLQAQALSEDWQQKRFECLPGLTGLWYTQRQRESVLEDIWVADAYYVATRTWREDLRIVLQTPRAWWKRATQGG